MQVLLGDYVPASMLLFTLHAQVLGRLAYAEDRPPVIKIAEGLAR